MNHFRALLATPRFRRFVLALLCNNFGNWCVIACLPILVAARFGAGMALVMSLGLRILPKVVLAPLASVLLRRFGAARVASSAMLAVAALTALLPFCSRLWMLELMVAAIGTLDLFVSPGLMSMRGPVTPAGLEMAGNTLCSVADRAAKVAGPAVGGLAVTAGFGPAFAGFAVLIALAALPVSRLMIPAAEPLGGGRRGGFTDFLTVMVSDYQIVGSMIAAVTYSVMLGGLRPFLFWANRDWFGGLDTAWTGLLVAQGVGALAGAVVTGLFVQSLLRAMSAYAVNLLFGILEGAFHLLLLFAQSSAQAIVILALAGIPEIISTAAWFTTIQARLAPARQATFFTYVSPLWDLAFALGIASAALHAEGVLPLGGYWALVSLTSTLPLLPLLLLHQRAVSTRAVIPIR